MNRKANSNPKTAAAKESTATASKTSPEKANVEGRKASERNPEQEASKQAQAQEIPTCTSRTVQLHACLGACAIYFDSNPFGESDPTFIDRFRAALGTKHLKLIFSTEAEVFDVVLLPICLDIHALEESADVSAPVAPAAGSAPGSAAR
ncbi:MAG TPA: hypothetical protein VIN35_14480 [Hydrogenophaga sp.]